MKKIIISSILILSLGLTSCTDNVRVKSYGGEATLNLPKGKKLVNITWKGENLWILTKDMHENDIAEKYSFKEESSFGIVQGEYVIHETK